MNGENLTGDQVEKKLRDIIHKLNLNQKSEEKLLEIRGFVENDLNNSIAYEEF